MGVIWEGWVLDDVHAPLGFSAWSIFSCFRDPEPCICSSGQEFEWEGHPLKLKFLNVTLFSKTIEGIRG